MFRHYIAFLRERNYYLLRDAQLNSRYNIVDGRVVFLDRPTIEHLSEGTTPAR
jgi:hypothetical protein